MTRFSRPHRRYWKQYFYQNSKCPKHDPNYDVVKVIRQELLSKSTFGKFSKTDTNSCFEICVDVKLLDYEKDLYLVSLKCLTNSVNPETGCLYQFTLNLSESEEHMKYKFHKYVGKILLRHCYMQVKMLNLSSNLKAETDLWFMKAPVNRKSLRKLVRRLIWYSAWDQPNDLKWSYFYACREKIFQENFGHESFTSVWQAQIGKKFLLAKDYKIFDNCLRKDGKVKGHVFTDNEDQNSCSNESSYKCVFNMVSSRTLKYFTVKKSVSNQTTSTALVHYSIISFRIQMDKPFMAVAICTLCHCCSYYYYFEKEQGIASLQYVSDKIASHVISSHLSFKFVKNYNHSKNVLFSQKFKDLNLPFETEFKIPVSVKGVYY